MSSTRLKSRSQVPCLPPTEYPTRYGFSASYPMTIQILFPALLSAAAKQSNRWSLPPESHPPRARFNVQKRIWRTIQTDRGNAVFIDGVEFIRALGSQV